MPLGSLRVRRWRSLLDAVALAVVFTVATQIAFNNGRIITFVYPMLALALGTLGTLLVLYVGEAIERERVRDVFSRFVPGDVVDQVLASADENLRLGGRRTRLHRAVLRPARLHELLRDASRRRA